MMIYKILRADEWADLRAQGETAGAPVDVADGFVHFSTAPQLHETLRRHFAGEADLHLLACDADAMGDALRWEPSRGGALFPHLFRTLRLSDVRFDRPVTIASDGTHDTGPLA